MKKIKFNPRIVKKTILFSILAILVIWFGVTVVTSFIPSYTTTDSRLLQTSIPAGEYKDYLLEKVGFNPAKYKDYNEDGTHSTDYEEFHKKLSQSQPEAEAIVKSYEDAIPDAIGEDNFKKGKEYVTSTGETVKGYYTNDSGKLSWTIDVDTSGFYYITFDYLVPSVADGSGSNAERSIYINGESLFDSLASINFNRFYVDDDASKEAWKNTTELRQDNVGNNLKPSQSEVKNVRVTDWFLQDQSGYIENPYLIYFDSEKENTITVESIREELVIFGIAVVPTSAYDIPTYSEYSSQYKDSDKTSGEFQRVEAENPLLRSSSSPTLYPISDRNSSANYPNHPVQQKYNAVGGSKWSTAGDWMAWDVTVEKAGLYNITFRSKQDQSRGLFTTRKLLVNDKLPFKEAGNCRFYYNSEYEMVTLGYVDEDGENQPYYVYLNEGVNNIKLQATVGDYSDLISQVQVVVDDLNDLYLRIISITTPNPDEYQEYKIDGREESRLAADEKGRYMEDIFAESAITLNNVSNQLAAITGEKSTFNNTLDELVLQIGGVVNGKDVGGFATNPKDVTKDLAEFKSNLSSLGTWILDIKSQSLTIESFYVYSNDMQEELPTAEDNWFKSMWFSVRGFFMSFFYDYEAVGKTTESDGEEIEVWYLTDLSSGREQANAVKSLIDQTFIPETNVNVILKIVAPAVLLPATLAGTGPDVAINVDGGLPVNYALRSAVYDMSLQPDFNEAVAARFTPEQMVPFSLMDENGRTGYYGFPNTMSFYVMFYRTDIFENNGWQVPKTWDEVIDLVTDMQVSNLEFFMPLEGDLGTMYATLLYQNGGKYYVDNQTKTAFDEEVALQSFEQWCSFFTDYSFELSANFSNRFRSGEMPIGISSYTLFNTLAVFAPDIAGKWEFAALPGVIRPDGTFDNTTMLGQTAVVIMAQGDGHDYTNSWNFVKWWTRTDTQVSYAKEMESILGSAARHNTANRHAVERLAWSSSEIKIITEMWDTAKGIPGVPGGYYIGRNLENSIRAVINNDENPRETFKEYIEQINAEITRKRTEFGLPTE